MLSCTEWRFIPGHRTESADGFAEFTLSGGAPSDLQVGDSVTVENSSVGDYNVQHIVSEITSSGQVITNVGYTENASGGTMSGWTLPQFTATWHLPPPTVSVELKSQEPSSSLTVTLPVSVFSSFEDIATVDVYVDLFESELGVDQDFDGVKVASLSGSDISNGELTTDIDVSDLLPFPYYVYAVINDLTNTPVTSTLGEESGTVAQTFTPEFAILGNVSLENNDESLTGWTVSATWDSTELGTTNKITTTTNSQGAYGFQPSELPQEVLITVAVDLLDPEVYVFFEPASGERSITYTGSTLTQDFVINERSAIQGNVFDDADQTGLGGWTVFLDSNGNGVLDPGESTATTGPSGAYSFSNIDEGTYDVALALMNGSTASYTFDADAVVGTSIIDTSGSPNQHTGTLESGASVGTAADFGIEDHPNADAGNQILGIGPKSLLGVSVSFVGQQFHASSPAVVLTTGVLSLRFDQDGFLRLYSQTTVIWESSNTGTGETLAVQGDGNLVIYSATGPVWASNTADGELGPGKGGRTLSLSGNGDLAIRNADGEVIWQTNTNVDLGDSISFVGQEFQASSPAVVLTTGDFSLNFEQDGFLRLYSQSTLIWESSNTQTGETLAVQRDGNLVIYSANGPVWASNTADGELGPGKGGRTLVLSPNGNLAILNVNETVIWQTQFVDVPTSADLSPGTGAFSAVGWIRRADDALTDGQLQSIAASLELGAPRGGWDFGLDTVFDFASQQTFDVGSLPAGVAVADFNGDAKPDLAVADFTFDNVSIQLNTTAAGATTASFANRQTFPAGFGPTAIAVGDFNADGKPDLAVANGIADTVSILVNTTATGATTASFSPHQTFATGNVPFGVAVGDFNADTKPDLAVTNVNDNTVSILLNETAVGTTTASFASQQTFATGNSPAGVAIGDFNGDAKLDLAISNELDDTLSVLLNETAAGATTASFASQQTFATGEGPGGVAIGDFNADAKLDLAVTNTDANTLSVLLNTTTAGATTADFASQQTFATGDGPAGVTVGDFNGDAKLDLAVANNLDVSVPDTVSILLNTTAAGATTASFASQQTFTVGSDPIFVRTGDFNADAKPDLALTNRNDGTVSILLNENGPRLRADLVENSESSSGSLALQDSTVIQSNTWYHVAFTYDPDADDNGDGTGAGMLKLYVNGVLTTSSSDRGTLSTSPDISSASGVSFEIGGQGGDSVVEPFTGFLDDMSVWDSALSAIQIQALHDGTTSPSYTQSTPTDPTTYTITISGDFDVEAGKDFGVIENSTISGSVQGNSLSNGELDPNPQPLAGWTVNLLDANGNVVTSTTSNAAGSYVLTGAAPGAYTVEVVIPIGWRQTSAPNDGDPITVGAGAVLTDQDFTHAQITDAQFNGTLVDDANGNGQWVPGELGRAGVTIFLDLDSSNDLSAPDVWTTTVTAGAYSVPLTDVPDGTYQLGVAHIPGRVQSGPAGGFHIVVVQGAGPQSSPGLLDFFTTVNAPPVITDLTTNPVVEGESFSFVATFTDLDTPSVTHSATVAWGDGTTSNVTIVEANSAGVVTGSHVYADGGFYDAILTITDGTDATVFGASPFTAIITGAGIQDGVLKILGTDGDDRVRVIQQGNGRIRINASFLPGGSKVFDGADADDIELFLFAGDDTVRFAGKQNKGNNNGNGGNNGKPNSSNANAGAGIDSSSGVGFGIAAALSDAAHTNAHRPSAHVLSVLDETITRTYRPLDEDSTQDLEEDVATTRRRRTGSRSPKDDEPDQHDKASLETSPTPADDKAVTNETGAEPKAASQAEVDSAIHAEALLAVLADWSPFAN